MGEANSSFEACDEGGLVRDALIAQLRKRGFSTAG